MTTDWAEFLEQLLRRAPASQGNGDAASWDKFQQLAESSEHAETLRNVVRLGSLLPAREQHVLVRSIAKLLAPVDWPSHWIEPRTRLVAALDQLVEATDPNENLSLLALQGPDLTMDMLSMGHGVLYAARDFLRRPCRRDELRTVALLCNQGIVVSLRIQRSSAKLEKVAHTQLNEGGTHRLAMAISSYADAARALNDAVGAVLFQGLHASLEGEP